MVIYFFVTFASLNRYFATRKMTKAMMMKLISSPRNAPPSDLEGPDGEYRGLPVPAGLPGAVLVIVLALLGITL